MANAALIRTDTIVLVNKSGGSVARGDVVIVDPANPRAFTTTTTGAYVNGLVGVVAQTSIANGESGLIALCGYVSKINLNASASLGQVFKTHTAAKLATPHALPMVAGDFGIVLGTGTAPEAILFGAPLQAAGASHTIQDEGTPLTARANLNFVGDGVVVSDDAGNNATVVAVNYFVPAGDVRMFYPLTTEAGNSPVPTRNNANAFQFYNTTTTNADGDSFSIPFYVPAGTYTFNVIGVSGAEWGKLDWYVDDVSIGTGQDWYSASQTSNVQKTIASAVLAGGRHILKGTVNGKNASSTGYRYGLTAFWFT